jgi:hypothetical protein
MPAKTITVADLLALFAAKAAAPPPETSQMLARHLQCKESLHLSHCVAQAVDRFAPADSPHLPTPTDLLPPLG